MATYPDGTMDVIVKGKIERRKYTVQMVDSGSLFMPGHMQGRFEPECSSNEQIVRFMGESIPTIISVS